MSKHDFVFYENRSTADVVSRGAKANPRPSYGRQTKRRKATPDEERRLAKGEYVRTREDGRGPNDPGAKKSRIRPALARKQKMRLTALQAKIRATNSGRR